MVIFSTLVKVAVQIELARWTISTGEPALTGYNRVPPRFGRIGWVNVLWIVVAISKVLQIGGIVGGTAVAFSVLLPLPPGGDPLGFTSTLIWTIIVAGGSIALLYSNRYGLIERGAVLLVVIFSIVTIIIAIGLIWTPFAYTSSDILGGLTLATTCLALLAFAQVRCLGKWLHGQTRVVLSQGRGVGPGRRHVVIRNSPRRCDTIHLWTTGTGLERNYPSRRSTRRLSRIASLTSLPTSS
jgi:hypothetical protein